jgi:protein SCO1/2
MLLIVSGAAVAKTQRIHGLVLAVMPDTGEVIVRHDPFGSMPSMSMPFRIVPRERAGELQVGSRIDADVDTTTEPWTLSGVTVSTTQQITATPAVPHGAPVRIGDVVPDTPFVDQSGRPFRFSSLRGQDVVLSFIYTRCQDPQMCPLISSKFNQLQRSLAGRKLHLVEVTLDPSYDRPPILARYGRIFGANPRDWTLAVGDAAPTLDFAARFGITAFPDPGAGIIHTENTVEIDRDGVIRTMIPDASWAPSEILADIDATDGKASNPLVRFDLWLSRTAVELCGNEVAGFSGITDLVVLVAVFGALGYSFYRLARLLFPKSA